MPLAKLTSRLPPRSFSQFGSKVSKYKINEKLAEFSRHFGDNLPPTVTAEELQIPDTKIASEATKLSSELCIPSVFRHASRTFMFGIAIGKHSNELRHIDREQFYLSCILSNIGLNDQIRELPQYKGLDFELISARHAYEWLLQQSYDRTDTFEIHEAIALHLSVGTVDIMDPQYSLLHQAAILDMVGGYSFHIRKEVIDAICKEFPRTHFAKEYKDLLLREASEKPECQVANDLCHGLEPLLMLNPLDPQPPEYPLSG